MAEKEFKPEKNEFKRGYEFKEPKFEPQLTPGINERPINQGISIET